MSERQLRSCELNSDPRAAQGCQPQVRRVAVRVLDRLQVAERNAALRTSGGDEGVESSADEEHA